jgi:hypothetical protein
MADDCEFRLLYMLLNQCFTETLSKYTLADMTDRALLAKLADKLTDDIEVMNLKRKERDELSGQGFGPVAVKQPCLRVPEKLKSR